MNPVVSDSRKAVTGGPTSRTAKATPVKMGTAMKTFSFRARHKARTGPRAGPTRRAETAGPSNLGVNFSSFGSTLCRGTVLNILPKALMGLIRGPARNAFNVGPFRMLAVDESSGDTRRTIPTTCPFSAFFACLFTTARITSFAAFAASLVTPFLHINNNH